MWEIPIDMKTNTRVRCLSFAGCRLLLLPLLICFSLPAFSGFAATIIFTHTGTGSGTIGTTQFSNAAFTITDQADTASIQSFGGGGFAAGFYCDDLSASISIAGVGTFDFTSATRTFVNNTYQIVGFSRAGQSSADLFNGPTDPSFASWNMLGSIGPISGTGRLLQWTSFPFPDVTTDGGTLIFDDTSSVSTVFDATVMPEPASLLFIVLGLACAPILRRRKSPARC